jgi:Ulp1 family protease
LINYFGALVSNCDDQLSLADRSRKKSAILSTYFYSKLMGEDEIYSYDSVTRWTKDVDIFKLDKILIPINENQSHWIVVKVSMSQKSIELYDPMGQRQNPNNYLNNVFHFIKDEHLKRKAEVLPDTSS